MSKMCRKGVWMNIMRCGFKCKLRDGSLWIRTVFVTVAEAAAVEADSFCVFQCFSVWMQVILRGFGRTDKISVHGGWK
jgi:hypothetical protein